MGLYPTKQGLKALKEALEKRYMKKIPTEDLVKMAEFTLNNNDLTLILTRINKNQVQLQELNLHPLMPASTWKRLNI